MKHQLRRWIMKEEEKENKGKEKPEESGESGFRYLIIGRSQIEVTGGK